MEGQVSRALPPPGTINEILYAERERTDDKLLMSKEARYQSQSDRVHENSTEKEDFSSNTSRSRKRISQSWHRRNSNSNALRENHINRYEIDTVKKDFPIENAMVSLTPTSTITTGAHTTFECLTTSSASSDICYPDFSRSMLERSESSRGAQEHSNLKVGGADEILKLDEEGKLGLLLDQIPRAGVGCQGCSGVRFVMCVKCNGSCKLFNEDGRKCDECNENGLIQCPIYC